MSFHSIRPVIAFYIASLFPLALVVVGLFGFSGSVRDANGDFDPGRVSKYIDIVLYAQAPFTIAVTVTGLAVLLSIAEQIGASHSRGIILLAAALGLIPGAILEASLSFTAPQVATLQNVIVVLAASALLSAATAATFCILAGIPWRKK